MILPLQGYVQQSKRSLGNLLTNPRLQVAFRASLYFLAGFGLSAASLSNAALPLSMGLVCACNGWSAVLAALGGALGYPLFWSNSGFQGVLWIGAGLIAALSFGDRKMVRQTPLLLPALSGLIVSAAGVIFQTCLQDTTPVGIYLIRVSLAAASVWLFGRVLAGRNPITDWLACLAGVLALAQIAPFSFLNLGFLAAGALAIKGAFPAAALAGLALDLATVTPVSMTAVMCGSFLVRFLPKPPKWFAVAAPISVFLLVMTLTQKIDYAPLSGLFLGSLLGTILPYPANIPSRRGETGVAQVRLEMAAGVLTQTEQLLLEAPEIPIDEDALVQRAAETACAGCPCRKHCSDSRKIAQLPAAILHKPLLTAEEIPIICRKSGRFLAQLHRAQEQLRSIQADRERQKEYRTAVTQQYRFLAEYLQDLSDQLAQRVSSLSAYYEPKVQIFGNRPHSENGDRCFLFHGTACRYYVLMCDGMGTGAGAVQEGRLAGSMLQRLLTAGYPAAYALESLNSLCALRSRAGAVTVELLEIQLDTGKATLYKWGAAPSYLLSGSCTEKIGIAGPPPGLCVANSGETAYRLSLRRGEVLVIVSDGVGEEGALHCLSQRADQDQGALAESLLESCRLGGDDDATVIFVTLEQK